ncbi:hypothetical protein ACH4E7_31895 [Kitasatospora sp. NPDC018058]|uniref:hypothetical protein n=1 Tax=Kitasatospora sp. NPDC018058 TaxID=3364025 RepID=UPI0037C1950F
MPADTAWVLGGLVLVHESGLTAGDPARQLPGLAHHLNQAVAAGRTSRRGGAGGRRALAGRTGRRSGG